MEKEEIEKVLNQIKQQMKEKHKDKTEEEIEHMMLDSFFQGYCEGQMSREDLTAFTIVMGYSVVDEVLDEVEKEINANKKGE